MMTDEEKIRYFGACAKWERERRQSQREETFITRKER